ncbi:hypothetical protein [Marivirga arenosa]|uniref:DUF3857 domain-containing protein n=1 Tax=Marivirga arenosa TaxID=3059076 RepID=A0AA51X313_9BACT|nr:hypothetical protein [Marivirga sp. BKB1-2]WNB16762.1 hypothetical protein QYS47_31680 [Marivirga sp. BKB1-2]
MLKNLLLIISTVFLTTVVSGQRYPFKVGKIDKSEFGPDSCSFYPEANSMIISEYGDLDFFYTEQDGWKYKLRVGVRKKVFDITDADDVANIKIRAYEPEKGMSKEEIGSIKAYSYNIVDGKIEETKLRSKEVFKKRLSDYWVEYSFAIPNVKKGTVIEYYYEKDSDYITNLHTWHFQKDIPVAYSEFRYSLPEWFNYQANQLGNLVLAEFENEERRNDYRISWNNIGSDGKINRGSGTMTSNDRFSRMIAKNILPLEDEPYMNNRSDVPSRIEFQLISTNFPNSAMEMVAGNYPTFNKEMLQSSSLGRTIENGRFIKDFEPSSSEELGKAVEIYNHLNKLLSWNEVYTFLSSDAGRKVYNDEVGNVAGLNLTLIAALREHGINAFPVILSTRGNGTVHPVYPSYNDFNYLIALVQIGEKSFFCDLTSGLSFGLLPRRCRNGNGWMVSESGGAWINLKQNSTYSNYAMIKTTVGFDSIVSEVSTREKGYAAIQTINSIKKESLEKYQNEFSSEFENYEFSKFGVSELDYSQPIDLKFNLSKSTGGNEVIYLETPTWSTIEKNPFKQENRFSSIDFAYSQSYTVFNTLTIPDGYNAELPESILVRLPGEAGSFVFQVSQNGNIINFKSDVKIDKTLFSTLEYQHLKQFYELIEKKHSELIILKKI